VGTHNVSSQNVTVRFRDLPGIRLERLWAFCRTGLSLETTLLAISKSESESESVGGKSGRLSTQRMRRRIWQVGRTLSSGCPRPLDHTWEIATYSDAKVPFFTSIFTWPLESPEQDIRGIASSTMYSFFCADRLQGCRTLDKNPCAGFGMSSYPRCAVHISEVCM